MIKTPCICTNLRQAALASTVYYDAVLAPSGLKVTMFRLLRHIDESPNITQLAKALGLDRSTLGRNLRLLEREGYVHLSTAEDERARTMSLTEKGEAALATATPLWESAQTRMADIIGPEVESLLETLSTLANTPKPKGRAHAKSNG